MKHYFSRLIKTNHKNKLTKEKIFNIKTREIYIKDVSYEKNIIRASGYFIRNWRRFLYQNRENTVNLSSNLSAPEPMVQSIHASEMTISLEDSIAQVELIVEVQIGKKIKELTNNDDTTIPKTIHSAKIISVLKGEALIDSEINILQDGVEELLVNNVPFYQTGENYIFILSKATPEKEFSNTYWTKKVYFEADEQLISLNYGENELATELEGEADGKNLWKNWIPSLRRLRLIQKLLVF